MLIKPEDIRKIRQVASNVKDDRLEIFIREAESLDIVPYIGAEFYQKLCNLGDIILCKAEEYLRDNDSNILAVENEGDLPINECKFLNGGYYRSKCGELKKFEGVRKALCYYAYSRFVYQQLTQVTPFGVVTKIGDESSSVDLKTVTAMSIEAKKIADEYMRQCLEFLQEVREVQDFKTGSEKRKRKFIAIGD